MAKKKLKCSKCDRTFSLPAHLARHVNTTHGKSTKKKVAKKRRPKAKPKRKLGQPRVVRKKKVVRPKRKATGRGPSVGGAMTRVVVAMRSYQNELASRRDAIDAEIAASNHNAVRIT